jgi:beta-lactamase class A
MSGDWFADPRDAKAGPAAESAIRDVFREAGVVGHVHAVDIDTRREIGIGADELVVPASVFKLPLLVAFFRRVASGSLDPAERITLRSDERCAGSTGISMLVDDVTISLRDLAALMITVSDNAAADALYACVGEDAIRATTSALELPLTHVAGNACELHDSLLADSGASTMSELWALLGDPNTVARLRALDPARTSRTTPREMTRLLTLIWRDRAAPADECAQMRRLLGLQVWPHRLASGFPYDDVVVSGKTGTLPTIRNEVGVIEYPDGRRYAVAVFTRAHSPVAVSPMADAAIGTTARLAVQELRAAR